VGLADADGIEAVTMRRLGEVLEVEAMSLYNHVANKGDLLDQMVDLVFSEIELPPQSDGWKDAMAARARSMRDALLRHRWALSLMESRTSPGPATLRHHDAVLGCSRAAGFSVEMAAHAFSLIDSYIYGFVLQEITLPIEVTGEDADVGEMARQMIDEAGDAFPHLAELSAEHVAEVGYNFADEFDFGLSLLLDAMQARAIR
jgi:AcrR family transcriptional regulator